MISTKSFLIKTLPLVLIVFSVFTVALTENLQLADGLSAYSDPLIYEIQKGETQMLTWSIVNVGDDPIGIEFYATGEGSELLVFEQYDTINAHTTKQLEVFVSIPKDHKDNVEFRPSLFALQRALETDDAGTGMVFNVQMESHPIIKIGDNPIYTEPKVADKPITPPKPEIKEAPKVEVKQEETLEEKMKKIQEANQAKAPEEVIVDDVFEEEAVPELQVDDSYIDEPIANPEPITQPIIQEEKIECDFFAMILSWFGMGKC